MDIFLKIKPGEDQEDPVKEKFLQRFRWNRFFLPGLILAVVVFYTLGPGGSARADPLMPTDLYLTFHIVENGAPYSLHPVGHSYQDEKGNIPGYFLYCIKECFTKIRYLLTGKNFVFIVYPEGMERFIIKGIIIQYSPHYYDDLEDIPPYVMNHVTIDIGRKICIYKPNSNDKKFQVSGCLPENATAGQRATATANTEGTATSGAQATATFGAQASASADARTATDISNKLTRTVRADTAHIAASETMGAWYAYLTGTRYAQQTKHAGTWNSPNSGSQSSPSYTAESTTVTNPQQTPEIRWQEGVSVFPIPYLAAIYLVVILLAICIEMSVALLMIRSVFEMIHIPPGKIILAVAVINAFSIPGAWWLMELLTHTASLPYLPAVLLTEITVVVFEALWYRKILSLHAGNALLLSLIANIVSYILGVFLFGF